MPALRACLSISLPFEVDEWLTNALDKNLHTINIIILILKFIGNNNNKREKAWESSW